MGTTTHNDDFKMILPALDVVASEYTNFRLSLVGVTSDQSILDGREHWLEMVDIPQDKKDYDAFVPWLMRLANSWDFAIAPLVDTKFNRSKSPLKLLDYSALGLPIVASDVEIYQTDAPAIKLTQNDSTSWIRAISDQMTQGYNNRELGLSQRNWVIKKHMLRESLKDFDEAILKMLDIAE